MVKCKKFRKQQLGGDNPTWMFRQACEWPNGRTPFLLIFLPGATLFSTLHDITCDASLARESVKVLSAVIVAAAVVVYSFGNLEESS